MVLRLVCYIYMSNFIKIIICLISSNVHGRTHWNTSGLKMFFLGRGEKWILQWTSDRQHNPFSKCASFNLLLVSIITITALYVLLNNCSWMNTYISLICGIISYPKNAEKMEQRLTLFLVAELIQISDFAEVVGYRMLVKIGVMCTNYIYI